MRIYLIAPCRPDDVWRKKRSTFTLPPMSLAIIASLTPKSIELKVTDEMVEDIDMDYPADLVALSVNTTSAPRSYEVARSFRSKGAKIVMGGIHPSVLPDEARQHADSVVIGEAETVWPQLIDDFLSGRLKDVYRGEYPDPAAIPMPKWDVLKQDRYFTPRTAQVSRGCPYGCGFCSSTKFFGTKYRMRPIERVIDELKGHKKNFLVFVDDNIVGRQDYSRELFKAMRPLKKRWVAQSSIDIARDSSLMELARQSGCAGVLIGLESIGYGNKDEIKKLKTASEYEAAIKELRRAGIGVHGSFVFGFDHDTPEVFKSTVDFVLRNRLHAANYCTLTPYPGTKLFEEFNAEGRITSLDWSKYDRYNIVFRPKNITVQELIDATNEAYKRTYNPLSILRRLPLKPMDIPYYLLFNFNYLFGSRSRKRV